MSGFDRLGNELEYAAQRGRPSTWARRARSAGGTAALAASLAIGAVLAVGAVALLHGHAGRSASTPARASAQPAPAAQVSAWSRLLSCPIAGPGRRRPVLSRAAPVPRMVAALGVLRAPWSPADAAPAGTCHRVSPLPVDMRFDVRYVRYVGPGLSGGRLFLVPASLQGPRLLPGGTAYAPAPVGLSAMVCLITVGGPPSPTPCQPLMVVEHPIPLAFGGLPPMSLSIARRQCQSLRDRVGSARCIARFRGVGSQGSVISGVLRDGIATVEVYARPAGPGKRLLARLPVVNNAYAFRVGRRAYGALTLVFRDARGRRIATMPPDKGTGSLAGVVTSLPAPPPSSASRHTAAPRRR